MGTSMSSLVFLSEETLLSVMARFISSLWAEGGLVGGGGGSPDVAAAAELGEPSNEAFFWKVLLLGKFWWCLGCFLASRG